MSGCSSLAHMAHEDTYKLVRTPWLSCSPTLSHPFPSMPLRQNHYFDFSIVLYVVDSHKMESKVCTPSCLASLLTMSLRVISVGVCISGLFLLIAVQTFESFSVYYGPNFSFWNFNYSYIWSPICFLGSIFFPFSFFLSLLQFRYLLLIYRQVH